MRAAFTALALGMATAGTAAAQAVDKEKLREAARLPAVSGRMGIACNADGGFFVEGEKTEPRAEIQKLYAAVKGDLSDAPRYYEMGTFHNQLGEEVQANQAYAKALELCRRQLKVQPNDGALLVLQAKALYACGKEEEAEAVFREAVKKAPQAWQSHQALGSYLQQKAPYQLIDRHVLRGVGIRELAARIILANPSQERIAKWERLYKEGLKHLDRAVALAPQEPIPYLARAHARSGHAMVSGSLRILRGEKVEALGTLMFSPAYVADVRRAAQLLPDDYRAVGLAAMAQVCVAAKEDGQSSDPSPKGLQNALRKSLGKSFQADLNRLEKIGKNRDPRLAAGAQVVLGTLYYILAEPERALSSLERAVALDPSRDNAWDVLGATLGQEKRFDRLLKICQDRVRYQDTAYSRFWLARVYVDAGQPAKAEEQVRVALNLEPKDFRANLGLAVLLLQRSDAAGALDEAARMLLKAREALGDKPAGDKITEYNVTLAIYTALRGDSEQAARILHQVLDHDAKNQPARDALVALGK